MPINVPSPPDPARLWSDDASGALDAVEAHVNLEAVMARAGGENFPVALRLLPGSVRAHLQAVYGYARLVDNLGDDFPGDRTVALDWVEAELDGLFAGTPRHEVFAQLAPTVARFGLDRGPFDQLLAANRLDQHKSSYADFGELLDYCKLSANPVGHLVLAIFEAGTGDRRGASDDICSALQILEHLQDVGEDAAAGRIYLPADDMEHFAVTAEDLRAPVAGANLRGLVAYEASRATSMFERGRWLVGSLRGPARLAVAGFVAGGLAGLDALAAAGYEVLSRNRAASRPKQLRHLVSVHRSRTATARRSSAARLAATPAKAEDRGDFYGLAPDHQPKRGDAARRGGSGP